MGDITLPSDAKMVQEICSILDRAMNIPVRWWEIDPAYVLRKDSLEEENEDHWFFGDDVDDPKYVSSIEEDNELFIKMLADEMKIVSYPTQLGWMEELNEKGQLLLKMSMLDALEREWLKKPLDKHSMILILLVLNLCKLLQKQFLSKRTGLILMIWTLILIYLHESLL
jgi:hypothetical protein